jgi:hypothetical protein
MAVIAGWCMLFTALRDAQLQRCQQLWGSCVLARCVALRSYLVCLLAEVLHRAGLFWSHASTPLVGVTGLCQQQLQVGGRHRLLRLQCRGMHACMWGLLAPGLVARADGMGRSNTGNPVCSIWCCSTSALDPISQMLHTCCARSCPRSCPTTCAGRVMLNPPSAVAEGQETPGCNTAQSVPACFG